MSNIANGNEERPTRFDHEQNVFIALADFDLTPQIMRVRRATICGINAIDLRYFIAIWGLPSPGSEYMWVEEAQLFETREAAEAEMETPE